jgi:hypothetical protein
MRRLTVGLVAAGYAVCFIVVCFGACLAPEPAAEHGCCQGEGLRAASRDCCSVMPGTSQAPVVVTDEAPPTLVPHLVAAPAAHRRLAPAVALTPSPPLVLRI